MAYNATFRVLNLLRDEHTILGLMGLSRYTFTGFLGPKYDM
jgi:hypothetical protein